MRHNGFHGIAGIWRELARALPQGALALGCGVLAAAGLAYGMQQTARHSGVAVAQAARAFRLEARPAVQRVAVGQTVRYQIAIVRRRYRRAVDLIVQVPRHLHVELSSDGRSGTSFDGTIFRGRRRQRPHARAGLWIRLKAARNHAVLLVTAESSTTPGAYSIRLRGVGGAFSASLALKLTVVAPAPASFGVGGDVGDLQPGAPQAIDLTITNPGSQPISITGLSVGVTTVSASQATAALPCTPDDFSVTQFAGSYPLSVPAHSSIDLAGLGVPADQWPQITLLQRPVDQDGCQGATVQLAYSGTASAQ